MVTMINFSYKIVNIIKTFNLLKINFKALINIYQFEGVFDNYFKDYNLKLV